MEKMQNYSKHMDRLIHKEKR